MNGSVHDIVVEKIADFMSAPIPEVFPRDLSLGKLQKPQIGNLVNVIVGIRRCGKTFRMYQEMNRIVSEGYKRESILYFNFEDERLKPYDSGLLSDVVETFQGMVPSAKEQAFFFFDEIQEVPDWGLFLRRMVDTQKVTMYATGSSSKMLSREIATEFRGRSISRELYPLSFSEYARFHYPFIDVETGSSELSEYDPDAMPNSVKSYLRQALPGYLDQGGFIPVQSMSNADAVQLLQDYANRAITYDVIDRYNVSNPALASSFLARCISHSARELSINKTNNDFRSLGVRTSRELLSKLLGYFQESCIVHQLGEFSRALSDNSKSATKIYAADTGMFRAFSPAFAQDRGQVLETAVCLHLLRRPENVRKGCVSRLKIPANGKKLEVDFVVGDALAGTAQRLVQVSVSVANQKTRKRDVESLRAAMSRFGHVEATIVTMDEREEIGVPEGAIKVIPAWEWLYRG